MACSPAPTGRAIPKVLKQDTPQFDPSNLETSPNARRVRWEQLLNENKGKRTLELAKQMLGDHFDSFQKKEEANERTLCGHVGRFSARGSDLGLGTKLSRGAGAGQGQRFDDGAATSLVARMGHPCGETFQAKPFLAAHPDYAWQEPYLRDMPAGPWTEFHAGKKFQPLSTDVQLERKV